MEEHLFVVFWLMPVEVCICASVMQVDGVSDSNSFVVGRGNPGLDVNRLQRPWWWLVTFQRFRDQPYNNMDIEIVVVHLATREPASL